MSGQVLPLDEMVTITPVSEPYWAALKEGHLTFQRCSTCENAWLPPREQCPRCLGGQWKWERASGHARVISWVVYHRALHPDLEARLPYNVAIIELDEGPRMVTNLLGVSEDHPIRIEAPVTLSIEPEGSLAVARFSLD